MVNATEESFWQLLVGNRDWIKISCETLVLTLIGACCVKFRTIEDMETSNC